MFLSSKYCITWRNYYWTTLFGKAVTGETLASSREIAEKFDKRSHCAKLHSEKYDS